MFAKILVDIIIVAILVSGIIYGIVRGFFLSVTRPFKWFCAIAIAISMSASFASAVVDPIIGEPLSNQLSDYLIERSDGITAENVEDELPTLLKIAAKIADVDFDSIEGESEEEIVKEIIDKISSPVIHFFGVIISFFVLYFVSKILLSILIRLLNRWFAHGVFGVFNKVLGMIFCGGIAFVIAWLFVMLFSCFINTPLVEDSAWAKEFNGGIFYDFFKRMSPLDILLSF